jgi:hypothetical protein
MSVSRSQGPSPTSFFRSCPPCGVRCFGSYPPRWASGFVPASWAGVELPAGRTVVLGPVVLKRSGAVEVDVADALDQRPVAGADLWLVEGPETDRVVSAFLAGRPPPRPADARTHDGGTATMPLAGPLPRICAVAAGLAPSCSVAIDMMIRDTLPDSHGRHSPGQDARTKWAPVTQGVHRVRKDNQHEAERCR